MTPVDPSALSAVSVELDELFDTDAAADAGGAVYRAPDRALAGWGGAAVLELPGGLADGPALLEAQERLAALGSGAGASPGRVVALGALPFDPHAPAHLVVPEVTVAEVHGSRWATLVAPRGAATVDELRRRLAAAAAAAPTVSPDGVRATTVGDRSAEAERYRKSVTVALDAIGRGEVDKVVLARALEVAGRTPFSAAELVRRLHRQEPRCTAFAVPGPGGLFVGASPELLVERHGDAVRSTPLAGTAALDGDRDHDERQVRALLESVKDRREHGPVVSAIREALAPRCVELAVPDAPVAARLHSVVHLATDIVGRLAAPAPGVLELLAELHPTPAVGGSPRAAALPLIARLEPDGRGPWAGAVGYADAAGDGQWVIGIRSALVQPHGSHLVAGAGIVEGSDPAAELAETTVKLRPVLQALYPDGQRLLGPPS